MIRRSRCLLCCLAAEAVALRPALGAAWRAPQCARVRCSRSVVAQYEELPPGWTSGYDQASGATYYINENTGESQWEPPQANAQQEYVLPIGWTMGIDQASGVPYYINDETGEAQWEAPPMQQQGMKAAIEAIKEAITQRDPKAAFEALSAGVGPAGIPLLPLVGGGALAVLIAVGTIIGSLGSSNANPKKSGYNNAYNKYPSSYQQNYQPNYQQNYQQNNYQQQNKPQSQYPTAQQYQQSQQYQQQQQQQSQQSQQNKVQQALPTASQQTKAQQQLYPPDKGPTPTPTQPTKTPQSQYQQQPGYPGQQYNQYQPTSNTKPSSSAQPYYKPPDKNSRYYDDELAEDQAIIDGLRKRGNNRNIPDL